MTDEEKAAKEKADKEKADKEKAQRDAADKGDNVPRSRLNVEIEKRKAAEGELKEVAEQLASEVPEEFRDLVPTDLPPGKLVAWIRSASAKGLFDPKSEKDSPDAKRNKEKVKEDLSDLTPGQMMAKGYGKK
jgi:hypothetical protein